MQAHAVIPPKPKGKGQSRGHTPAPPKEQTKVTDDTNAAQPTKGKGKGKKGKTEKGLNNHSFFRGTYKKGDHCNYEHQVDSEGKPIPVGPEFLQCCDDAVKRSNEARAQNEAKVVPRGGVGVSSAMLMLEQLYYLARNNTSL